jgi:hypothetical protein
MTRNTRWTRWIVSALAALLLLLGTFGVAAAEKRGPTGPQPTETNYAELEQLYRLRQQQVRSLDEMLRRDERRGAEVAELIARAKAEGKDTAAIERALAAYRTGLGVARAAWKTAAYALKTHAGFNDAGKVTNPDQARATLKTAGSALEQSYRTARYVEEMLNKALAYWRGRK